jgi:retron-type reverse transcriptase
MHESKQEKETSVSQLTEEILSRKNMALAYRKVKANKGASGVDGISVDEVHEYLKANWPSIKERIQKRKYKPQPVLYNAPRCQDRKKHELKLFLMHLKM